MRAELLVVALLLSGCPGQLEEPARWNGRLCEDVPAELAQRCAGSGCHSGEDPAAGLDLVAPGVGDRIAGMPANGIDCDGMGAIADPSDPEGSLLYLKLGETPPCGDRMPLTGPPLTEPELDCMRSWIETL
jgi:hypothetical protein